MFRPLNSRSGGGSGQYRFSGSPEAILAASNAHQAEMQANAQIGAAQAQAAGQAAMAQANQNAALYQQPANFANAFGNAYNSYAQGMGGAYAAQAGGLGSIATALANERGNLYGANAMMEAARMGALGNLGSAGIGAYGSMGNAAMGAWAQNQNAYNNAAATMHAANQSGLAGYGAANAAAQGNALASQASAAGNIGAARAGAMGQIGRAQIGANAIAGLGLGSPGFGGSFSANGVGGPIGSGSFSGQGIVPTPSPGGGMGRFMTEADVFGGGPLSGLSGSVSDPGIVSGLQFNARAGMRQLDDQHYSSRGMPSQMMNQGLAGLLALTNQSQGALRSGANQFYDNQRYAGDQAMSRFDTLASGVQGGLGGAMMGLQSGFNTVGNQIQGMWDNSLANLPQFTTPSSQLRRARDAQMLQERYRNEDNAAGRPMGARFPTVRYM
jgi:hypothetical protein